MEAIQVNEAMGGWQLREPHIRVLMELYPTLQTPLSCLLDPDPCQAVQCRPRRNLFSVCLASLDNTSSIEWRLPLSVLVKTERQSLAVLCSPATLLVDGLRRFELQMQFIDGATSETSSAHHLLLILHLSGCSSATFEESWGDTRLRACQGTRGEDCIEMGPIWQLQQIISIAQNDRVMASQDCHAWLVKRDNHNCRQCLQAWAQSYQSLQASGACTSMP